MYSLMKMNERGVALLRLVPEARVGRKLTYYGVELYTPVAIVSSSKIAPTETEVVTANQRAHFRFGTFRPQKHAALIEINPALNQYGVAVGPRVVEPTDAESDLSIYFTAHKQLDIADLEWIVRIYLLV